MKTNFILKHCLTTILLSPFIHDLTEYWLNESNPMFSYGTIYIITIFFSFIFSSPTHIMYGVLSIYLKDKNFKTIYLKSTFIIYYSFAILITFYFVFGLDELSLTISYVSVSIISGLIFKLK